MVKSPYFRKIFRFTLYLGYFLVIVGIPIFIMDKSERGTVPLLIGLYTVFISPHKREDERSISLRTMSIYVAVILAYSFKIVTSNLFEHQLISWQMTAINHFMILMFSLSLIIFYIGLYRPHKG